MIFLNRLRSYGKQYCIHLASVMLSTFGPPAGAAPPILDMRDGKNCELTDVDTYWSEHTVNAYRFRTRWESMRYYQWMLDEHPLLAEFMEFDVDRTGQVILDYGCGPGNDLFRFLVLNNAAEVTGIDVSPKALLLAGNRLAVHHVDSARARLVLSSNNSESIPAEDETFDHVNCAGVLMHTNNPERLLREFARVMKKGATANVMVYGYDSLHLHLYVAYDLMIRRRKYQGMSIREAFSKTTDGEECPVSRCYTVEEFTGMCREAGLAAEHKGGYFSIKELLLHRTARSKAVADVRLAECHKKYLRALTVDSRGYPLYRGKHAGVGEVYRLRKLHLAGH